MRLTILGCGSSGGVPLVGNVWGACDPANPLNRRRRASVLVEQGDTAILVDTSSDCRAQLLDAGVTHLSAVLYTHDHADHCHGIDDIRFLVYHQGGGQLDAWSDQATLDALSEKFPYIFPAGQVDNMYPALLQPRPVEGPFRVGGIDVRPFVQGHGPVNTLGFRFGDIAYSTDVISLDEAAFEALEGVRTWVVGAVHWKPHKTHAHIPLALEWIDRIKPERAVITHMSHHLDYEDLRAALPPGVEPAYDGMVLRA